MKNFRIILTAFAFVFAAVGTFASLAGKPAITVDLKRVSDSFCVANQSIANLPDEDCSTANTGTVCQITISNVLYDIHSSAPTPTCSDAYQLPVN
jgi:hypothetical protein